MTKTREYMCGDSLPIKLDDIHKLLEEGNSLYFFIYRRHKMFFKRQTGRINRSEILISKRGSVFSKIISFVYMVYVGVVGALYTTRDRGLEKALLVYSTSWRYISTIEGEDVGSDKIKVTFNGIVDR